MPVANRVALAVGAGLALCVADLLLGPDLILTGAYVVVPVLVAGAASARATLAVAVAATVAAALSSAWNDNLGSGEWIVETLAVAVAGGLAVLSSRLREGEQHARDEAMSARLQLEQTLGTLAEAVTVSDREGNIRYANDAAAALLGYPSAEALMAEPPGAVAARWQTHHEDGRPLSREDTPSWRVVNGQQAEPLLMHIVHRETGEERWRLVKATPLRDTSGELLAVNVVEDVTEVKQAELRSRHLAEAGELLASSLDYEETLQHVADLVVPELADWCGVDVVDARGMPQQLAVAHADPEKAALARRLRELYPPDPTDRAGGIFAVLETGRPELYPELPDELLVRSARDERHLEMLRSLGAGAGMIVPMRAGGRTIGAISLVSAESGRPLGDEDLAFACELARVAAIAVENAKLYTQRAEAAETLQRSLLPARLPSMAGWAASAMYRAGEAGAEVGGDFYDVVRVDRGWRIVMGDVTGKGVKAAALTALARYTIATAGRFDPSPAVAMEMLNEALADQPAMSLVTATCAHVIVTRDGVRARVTCAGHPPPLLLRPGEAARPVGDADPLLGLRGARGWRETEIALEPGDVLLLYTDGATDTPGSAERFGEARLRAVAADGPLHPDAVLARLDAAMDDWQAGEVLDDRALLALQFVSLEAALRSGEEDGLHEASSAA